MKRTTLWAAPTALTALTFAGCQGGGGDYKAATPADVEHAAEVEAHEEEHGHVHAAPHGGHLVELGDHQYNLEVLYPDGDGNLSLYVLDAHAENPVMVAASDIEFEVDGADGNETELELTAVEPQDGKASQFTAPASALGDVKDVEGLHAHAHVTIDGTEYTGGLDHDHEDGDHDEAEHKEEMKKETAAEAPAEAKPEEPAKPEASAEEAKPEAAPEKPAEEASPAEEAKPEEAAKEE